MKTTVKQTKEILVRLFGKKEVSVRSGTGKDSHWVEANVELPRPPSCVCVDSIPCSSCKEVREFAYWKAFDCLQNVLYEIHYPKDDVAHAYGRKALELVITINYEDDQ